jgi:hypothetical protein
MNAVSRKNLTGQCAVDANGRRYYTRQRHALSDRKDRARFGRTNAEMHLGRERPPAGQARGEEGGSQMGVAHAPAVALLGCDSGADSRAAAQSAAGYRRESAGGQKDRASVIVQRAMQPLHSAKTPGVSWGTVLPSFGSPTLFPSANRNQGRRDGPMTVKPTSVAAGSSISGEVALTRVAASSIESSAPPPQGLSDAATRPSSSMSADASSAQQF